MSRGTTELVEPEQASRRSRPDIAHMMTPTVTIATTQR
jgi:hypothetical protein